MPTAAKTERHDGERRASPKVRVSSTLDGGVELVDRIPISTTRDQMPVVAMSIGASEDPDCSLPGLRAGDQLEVFAELEVTVDLTPAELAANSKLGGKATGEPYDFAPAVAARLLLASSPTATSADKKALAVGKAIRIKVDHERHHAIFVFDGIPHGASVDIPSDGLPWSGRSYVNLVLSASHRNAEAGQVVIVGQNNFDGKPKTKMATIALLRRRPAVQQDPTPIQIQSLKAKSFSMDDSASKVVYSVPLKRLKANEQLRTQALIDAEVSASSRGRLSTEVFLADKPEQSEPTGKSYAASISSGKGKLTRANGSNCPPGETTRFRKTGTVRITKDADRPVYLNVACTAGNPTKADDPGSIRLLSSGSLKVVRFGPESFG